MGSGVAATVATDCQLPLGKKAQKPPISLRSSRLSFVKSAMFPSHPFLQVDQEIAEDDDLVYTGQLALRIQLTCFDASFRVNW